MNLFIDANIFLDFYHLSDGDIEELKKLVALVENGHIVLFSSPQLREEVKRNRDAKISHAIRDFRKASFKLSFPAFCKYYDEYEELRAHIKDANEKHAELVQKAMGDVKGRCLAADVLINDLLNKSQEVEPEKKLFDAAIKRFRLGNPPGKKKVTLGEVRRCNEACLEREVGGNANAGGGIARPNPRRNSVLAASVSGWRQTFQFFERKAALSAPGAFGRLDLPRFNFVTRSGTKDCQCHIYFGAPRSRLNRLNWLNLSFPRNAAVAALMIDATYLKAYRAAFSLNKGATRHG